MAAKGSVKIKNEIEFTRILLCPNYLPLQDLQMLIKKLSEIYSEEKFSQYLCFLIKSTILDLSLSNFIHELYYRNFTCTCLLRDK